MVVAIKEEIVEGEVVDVVGEVVVVEAGEMAIGSALILGMICFVVYYWVILFCFVLFYFHRLIERFSILECINFRHL